LVVVWNRVDHRPLPLSRRRDRLVRLLAGKQLGIGLNVRFLRGISWPQKWLRCRVGKAQKLARAWKSK
jgi:hypothetical protein